MTDPIRLLISDIDGTLVLKDKSLSAPVAAAIKRLEAAGVIVTLISARPLSGMLALAERLGVTAPLGAFNGGTIAKADGSIVSAHRLTPEIASRSLSMFREGGATPWLFADGEWYAPAAATTHDDSERVSADREPVIVEDFTPFLARVDKLVGVSDDAESLAKLEASMAAALGHDASVARSQTYYLDVTALEANKGAGVTQLAKALGVPLSQTAVIGDGTNDIRMFKVAGFSVAMGNGSDEVRAAADAVTGKNSEDGVAQAIDRLILPRAAKRQGTETA